MLSVEYHISYWAVAAWAVAIYRLLALHPQCVTAFRFTIGPAAAYAIYASSIWQFIGKKRPGLTLYTHRFSVAFLLVALGSVTDYFQLPDDKTPKPTALIHLLSAFVALGVLESLRQNVCLSTCFYGRFDFSQSLAMVPKTDFWLLAA